VETVFLSVSVMTAFFLLVGTCEK